MATNKMNMADTGRGGKPVGPGAFSKPARKPGKTRNADGPLPKTRNASGPLPKRRNNPEGEARLRRAWNESNGGAVR